MVTSGQMHTAGATIECVSARCLWVTYIIGLDMEKGKLRSHKSRILLIPVHRLMRRIRCADVPGMVIDPN